MLVNRAWHRRRMEVTDSSCGAQGAASFLEQLPSRGYFTASVHTSTPGGLRSYICEHDTSPPEEQFIKTDTTNILIRSLTLKKDNHKGKETSKGKRQASERPVDEKLTSKKANTRRDASSSSSRPTEKDLQGLTVEKLKALLKEKGLPVRGKKDELIARLRKS